MITELAENLSGLASRINDEHRKCEESARATLEHAISAGDLLEQAKKAVGHGGWADWLEQNFEGSVRTAQRYMQIMINKDLLEAEKTTCVSYLTASGALALIREKKKRHKPKFLPPAPTKFNLPSSNGRVLRLYRNEEKRAWEVAYGPNAVGLRIKELTDEAEQRPEFDELREQIADCAGKAERLRAEGQKLIDEADKWSQTEKDPKRDLRAGARKLAKRNRAAG